MRFVVHFPGGQEDGAQAEATEMTEIGVVGEGIGVRDMPHVAVPLLPDGGHSCWPCRVCTGEYDRGEGRTWGRRSPRCVCKGTVEEHQGEKGDDGTHGGVFQAWRDGDAFVDGLLCALALEEAEADEETDVGMHGIFLVRDDLDLVITCT